MFDIGMFEMIMIGVIALLVLGPERMPEAARAAGRWVGKARRFITGIKQDVSSQLSVSELNELRQLRNDLAAAQNDLNQFRQQAAQTLNEEVTLKDSATSGTAAPATDSGADKKLPDQS